VAIIENALLISQESMDKYYPICLEILKRFREKTTRIEIESSPGQYKDFKVVSDEFRDRFLNLCRSEEGDRMPEIVEMTKMIKDFQGYHKGEKTKKLLIKGSED